LLDFPNIKTTKTKRIVRMKNKTTKNYVHSFRVWGKPHKTLNLKTIPKLRQE
jgi:hypothetical protein